VQSALESHGMHVAGSEIAWLPKTTVRVEGKTAESLIRLLEEIDELDDVQKVDANFDMDVADMASA
jgi:transcriptional/translational regulatory protein YebC/TACO1